MDAGLKEFDFRGEYILVDECKSRTEAIWRITRPLIMNAGVSTTGPSVRDRGTAMLSLLLLRRAGQTNWKQVVRQIKSDAQRQGREIAVYTVGVVTCMTTQSDAEDYHRQCIIEQADWKAVDNILGLRGVNSEDYSNEDFQNLRIQQANGRGGLPLVGDPDFIAGRLEELSAAGVDGIAISFVNYLEELPYFVTEVLPRLVRLGLRLEP